MTHTKLPWRHDGDSIVAVDCPKGGGDIIASWPEEWVSSKANWVDNAAFIVLSCNNHKRLVEALKRAVSAARPSQYPVKGSDGETVAEMPEWLIEAVATLDACEVG